MPVLACFWLHASRFLLAMVLLLLLLLHILSPRTPQDL
jgi:hypothetical protein